MKILVACETSGVVRDAFRRKGHYAISLDLLPTEQPGPHIEDDLADHINRNWDMIIAHPPCTYLSGSGYHWVYRQPGRMEKVQEALAFALMCFNSNAPKLIIENPVGILSSHIRKPDQIIQPYDFGENASKRTCLWLRGVKKLVPTQRVFGRMVEWPIGSGKFVERWDNQTDSGQNKLSPSEDRWKLRSRTYQGIADAMADAWG